MARLKNCFLLFQLNNITLPSETSDNIVSFTLTQTRSLVTNDSLLPIHIFTYCPFSEHSVNVICRNTLILVICHSDSSLHIMQGFNKQENKKIELAWESDKIPIWCCYVFNFVGKLHFHTFTALSTIDLLNREHSRNNFRIDC